MYRKNIILLAVVVTFLFCLLFSPVRQTLSPIAYSFAVPLWKISNSVSEKFNAIFVLFQEKNELLAENKFLLDENARAQAMILDRNLLAEKVAKLEDALGRSNNDNRVVAQVLVGQGYSPYDILVIDAGIRNGVEVGNMVVYAGGGIIGEVIEIENSISKVKLFSTPGEKHSVFIGQNHFPAEIFGAGMGNFKAKVPQGAAVSVGDIVASPRGDLVFGVVSLIKENPVEPFKELLFRVPFNITEVRSVEVITDKQ